MSFGAETAGSALTVAVIDDDSGFLQVLTRRMDGQRWRYRVSAGALAPEALVSMRLDALVVDLALLGPAAWTYLDTVRARLPGLGIVVCTGRSSVAQRVHGLRAGADDWMTKPCHPEELIARLEAVARRRQGTAATETAAGVVEAGELEIRQDQFQAFVNARSVELTRREFELLGLLARSQGQVLQREDIYQRVWGYAMAHGDRSVDVFVRKLRQKLERASPGWRYIHTHFGVGYRFDAQPADGSEGPGTGTGPPTARHDVPGGAAAPLPIAA